MQYRMINVTSTTDKLLQMPVILKNNFFLLFGKPNGNLSYEIWGMEFVAKAGFDYDLLNR